MTGKPSPSYQTVLTNCPVCRAPLPEVEQFHRAEIVELNAEDVAKIFVELVPTGSKVAWSTDEKTVFEMHGIKVVLGEITVNVPLAQKLLCPQCIEKKQRLLRLSRIGSMITGATLLVSFVYFSWRQINVNSAKPAIFLGLSLLATCVVGAIGWFIDSILEKVMHNAVWERKTPGAKEILLLQTKSKIWAEHQAIEERKKEADERERRARKKMLDEVVPLWERAASEVLIWRSQHPIESHQIDTSIE
ncbi:MAG: hypothetical protein EOP06_31700, partial [Proteobacteria bacterium]